MTFLLAGLLPFISCEDVIDVEVPDDEPRLIIDAIFKFDSSQRINVIQAKVSLTNSFFEEIPVTKLMQITLGARVLNERIENSGIYEAPIARIPEVEEEFIFQVDHDDRLYFAWGEFQPAPPIDNIAQGSGFFEDEEETEIVVSFTDIAGMDNFYVFEFGSGNFFTVSDEFIKDEQFSFSYFYEDELNPGDSLDVTIMGADLEFYNYINLLIEQSENDLDVFTTPAATVRGNIFDVTELDNIDVFDNVALPNNFPLGFFAMTQTHTRTIVIE